MKPSERIRAEVQDLQNRVYNHLSPRMRKRVNKTYRIRQRAKPKVKSRAEQGRRELHRRVLGSTDSLRDIMLREVVGYTPRKRRRRVVVGK